MFEILFVLGIVVGVIVLNIANNRARAKMTAEERTAEDESTDAVLRDHSAP